MGRDQAKAESFLRHLEPLRGALEAYCRRALFDSSAVEDVLQSAVANAFRNFHMYAEGTNFRAWMFRYVHFETLDYNRRRLRTLAKPLPEEIAAPETTAVLLNHSVLEMLLEEPDFILDRCDEELAAAVRGLPSLEKTVLLLHSVGEFKYREIAQITEVPLGTVMSNLARARLRLRQRLIDYGLEKGLLATDDS